MSMAPGAWDVLPTGAAMNEPHGGLIRLSAGWGPHVDRDAARTCYDDAHVVLGKTLPE